MDVLVAAGHAPAEVFEAVEDLPFNVYQVEVRPRLEQVHIGVHRDVCDYYSPIEPRTHQLFEGFVVLVQALLSL